MLALRDLDARLRSPGEPGNVPFPIDAEMLAGADNWTLTTRSGNLDVMFSPSGTNGYDDLRRGARRERIAGVSVSVAALADVIRSKEAANREKDSMQLPILRGRSNRFASANASTPRAIRRGSPRSYAVESRGVFVPARTITQPSKSFSR